MNKRKKIAIVGSGIAGLSAAHFLNQKMDVTLFEKNNYYGGHANSVEINLPNQSGVNETFPVDTGFLVFNERTYPGLINLFNELQVKTSASDMSFSVQADVTWMKETLEWSGSNLNTVFSQRKNLFKFKFWKLLREILRFNKLTTEYIQQSLTMNGHELDKLSLREYLKINNFGEEFQEGYLLPMLGCIWSCELDTMLKYPIKSLASFCHNHGLLQVLNRPQWYTVHGGSVNYVKKITDHILDKRLNTCIQKIERKDGEGELQIIVHTEQGVEYFDAVVLACHAPQALDLLEDASKDEKESLGGIKTQKNIAILHTDETVMPSKRIAWAAWNFENLKSDASDVQKGICLHYWLNKLQPLPFKHNVFVTLNEKRKINPSKIIDAFHYEHPILDDWAVKAQQRVKLLSGQRQTWYAGAWLGSGFHEDGFQAGWTAAQSILKEFTAGV